MHQIHQGKNILGINYNKQKMKQIVKRSVGYVEHSNNLSIKELHTNMCKVEKTNAKTSILTFGTAKKSLLALVFAFVAATSFTFLHAQTQGRQMPSIVVDVRDNLQIVRYYNNGQPFEFNLMLNSLVNTATYEVSEMDCNALPTTPTLLDNNFNIVTTSQAVGTDQALLTVQVSPTASVTPGTYCFGVFAIDQSGICVSDIFAFNVILLMENPEITYTELAGRYDSLYVMHDSLAVCHGSALTTGFQLPLAIDTTGVGKLFEVYENSLVSYWWEATANTNEIEGLRTTGFGRVRDNNFILDITDTLSNVPEAFHGVITYTVGAAYKTRPDAPDSMMLQPYTFTVITSPETERELLAQSTRDSLCQGETFQLTFSPVADLDFGNGFGIYLRSTGAGDLVDTFLTAGTYTHTVVNDEDIHFEYYLYDSLTGCIGRLHEFHQYVNPTVHIEIAGGNDYVVDSIVDGTIFLSMTQCPGARLLIDPASFVQPTATAPEYMQWSWFSQTVTGITYHDTISPMRGIVAYDPAIGQFVNIAPMGSSAVHYLDRDNTALNNDQEAVQQYTMYTSLISAQGDGQTDSGYGQMSSCSVVTIGGTGVNTETIREAKIVVTVTVKPKPGLQLRFTNN